MPSPYKSTLEYKKVTAETFHATPTHSITQKMGKGLGMDSPTPDKILKPY